jgi:hypothetical protein
MLTFSTGLPLEVSVAVKITEPPHDMVDSEVVTVKRVGKSCPLVGPFVIK